jgi:hypothetical protein
VVFLRHYDSNDYKHVFNIQSHDLFIKLCNLIYINSFMNYSKKKILQHLNTMFPKEVNGIIRSQITILTLEW